jgi:hypothetical protein
VNPQTFLPGRSLELAPTPRPGDKAPELPARVESGRPAVVAFMRHTGCPFAEATLRSLRDAARSRPDVQWVAISHAPAPATDRWVAALGGAGDVILLSDTERRRYAAWGLGRTSLAHFLGRRSLVAVGRLARQGIRNRHPHGTRWQRAGTFAVDRDGVVRWRHLPEHAGELPTLEQAAASIAGPAGPA